MKFFKANINIKIILKKEKVYKDKNILKKNF